MTRETRLAPWAPERVDAAALRAMERHFAATAEPPWLHGEVARRMAERLPVIKLQPARVVEWHAWSGASDGVLQAAYPKALRRRVEPTPALAARSAGRFARTPWWRGSRPPEVLLEAEVPEAAGELLWANMMLHRAADPRALLERWQRTLEVGGFLMFSCFGPDTLAALRALYARLGWPPPAQDFIDMHDLGDLLVQAGFADPVMDQQGLTLTFADAPSLLAELRGLGRNASPARRRGWVTPRWRERLERELEALRGADGRLALGLEIVQGHAFKAAPRVPVQAETAVSLEAMRAMVRGGPR